ncbi:hypothetical protein ES703_88935 [subsurface metagenome]
MVSFLYKDTVTRIDVRFGELHIPQDFIRIDSTVCEVVSAFVGLSEEEAVLGLWDFVCRTIEYPSTATGLPADRHVLHAFPYADLGFLGGLRYRIKRSNNEWWEFPSETLSWKIANCEGTAIALCALLRCYGIGAERVKVVVGEIPQGRHAWVTLDGCDLETTLSSAPNPAWRTYPEYVRHWCFNDMVREGDIVFVPKADEREKLDWIGSLWGHPTKTS